MNREEARRLGTFIRRLRRASKLSARNLAPRIGVDASQILRLERGEVAAPQAAVLTRIAEHFQLPASDLFARAGYPVATSLPSIEPYLRAKYPELSEPATLRVIALVHHELERTP